MTAVLEGAKQFKVNEWKTLNTAASPNKLPPGHSPNNNNVWVDEKPGSIKTSKGYVKLGTLPSNLPPTFGIEFFKASDGTSRVVVGDGQNVYQTTDYVNYTSVVTGLSPFFQLRGKVIRDKLWLTNGSDPAMTWDGAALVILDGTGGTPNVPKGKYIEYHDERVWLFGIDGDLSSLRFSALADASGTEIAPDDASAWPSDNELQISEGDADIGTGIFLYRGYLYCSKQRSFWRIVGYDEYSYDRVKAKSSTGTRFQESIQIKDDLVHFIGVDGFYVFDGEESKRISDIIDPENSDAGVFAFRNLQQPLLNNQFWNVSESASFAAGAVPANLTSTGDQLTLVAADDSLADFNAGTQNNTSASLTEGSEQLGYQSSGGSTINVTSGGTPSLPGGVSESILGVATSINDQSESTVCGYRQQVDNANDVWQVIFTQDYYVGKVTIGKFYYERNNAFSGSGKLQYTTDGTIWLDVPSGTVSIPASAINNAQAFLYGGTSSGAGSHHFINEVDIATTFPTIKCRGIRFYLTVNHGNVVIKELYVYRAPFQLTGTFRSKTLDYFSAPVSYGMLAAAITSNGESYQFFTESSSDGSTWDAAVNVANGAAIGSILKRYLRWGVTFTSSTGDATPVVDSVFVGGAYVSEVHDTGGNIFAWGALQASMSKLGQTVTLYYRSDSTGAGVLIQSWTAIVPGAIPASPVSSQFIQIRAEFSTIDATLAPSLQSFTVNWILDSGGGINTLQNVSSLIILNRYLLNAATIGAAQNDIQIILGKSTSQSPWHKKDFNFLCMFRFQDYYVAGSSLDGSLYRLETGYSKDGSALDSYYETADFVEDNFQFKGKELLVTADRLGPYLLYVGWSTDGGVSWTEKTADLTRPSGGVLSWTYKFNIDFMGDQVRFRVRTNMADQPFSVDELVCNYLPQIQRGSLSGS